MPSQQELNFKPDVKSVIVVGAGTAGVAAAFRLKQAGLPVRIFEADNAVGGKLRSKVRDGFVIDQGAIFMPSTHHRMIALAQEAGFSDEIESGGAMLSIFRDGKFHNFDINNALIDFIKTKLYSTRTKLSMRKLASEVWRSRLASFERISEAAVFDTETAAAWALRTLGKELADNVVDLVCRGMAATPSASISRVDFMGLLYLLTGAKLLACKGGMGAYANKLIAGCDIELNATVEQVVTQGDKVEISWRNQSGQTHKETAAGCVVAGSVETALQVVPELDTWRKEFLTCTGQTQY